MRKSPQRSKPVRVAGWALPVVLILANHLWANDAGLLTRVTATASSSHNQDMGPEKTVDGSGLDAQDRHSTVSTDMWLSGQEPNPWIQFEFDRIYHLDQMWIWNHNQLIERFIGLGARDVVVEHSVNGSAWTVLPGVTQLAQATSAADYTANTIIDFKGVVAKYVRITISENFGIMPQYGLSEVRFFCLPPNKAAIPSPADGSENVPRDTRLRWIPGQFAALHRVYISTVFEDVNSADPAALVTLAPDVNPFDPGPLAFGQTYYWRVDEVNGAPDHTVFTGDIWRFTAEPYALPVNAVTATASSVYGVDMGPENTVNDTGLNAWDQHSVHLTEMWLSGIGDPAPWIQYTFDKAYKLHELWVWNSNQLIEPLVGAGVKDVLIEYSTDGIEWTALGDVTQLAQAPGTADYTANNAIDVGGILAQTIKLTIQAGYGILPQYGLSAVRFYHIPTYPREPQPADQDLTTGVDVPLNWRAGREAVSHEVYLGTTPENLARVETTDDNDYCATDLNYDTTYFWQIVEVNASVTPSSYAGDIWSFRTPAFATVDDFEAYDDNCNRVYFGWADGLGHDGGEYIDDCEVTPSNGNGSGSIVGHNLPPFTERAIVNVGSTQSMPLSYDNVLGPSETTLRLAGQDWTAGGIQTLTLFFYGQADNTGQLYVKINDHKVACDGDAANITREQWQQWKIDLIAIEGLENVTTLTLGVDGVDAMGLLYIDDIRLYP